ncbi:hypothetical protein [Listeria monocytogenes]|nr:hypothetical protein [Listeria monocytogenes]
MKDKLLLLAVTVGVALGNLALMASCPMGLYEPKKPDILKDE